jgi:hypothetical protein
VCWLVHATGQGALTRFDDATRRTIRDRGGLVGIFAIEPQRAHLLWCESALVRFEDDCGVVWTSALPEGVQGVGIRTDFVVVNELAADGGFRISLLTGDRLPASPAAQPDG